MSSIRLLLTIFGVTVTAALNSTQAGSKFACEGLASQLTNITHTPGSSIYAQETRRAWDKRSNQDPTCVFTPSTADDIATGVRVMREHNAQFAILAGGHMNFPGANGIDGGVLLSLGNMKELQLSEDKQTINVGPGNKWIDVYTHLEPHGLYAIGGRLKTIGVSGLTLLGGANYFNNKYGFAMDNVVRYDVILGNGTQVIANATSHPQLFWALKGGVSNFGVVSRFVYRTHSIPQVSTTIQAFDESGMEAYISALCDFVHATGNDPSVGAGGVFNINYNVTTKFTTANILGSQEGTEEPPSRFQNFSSVPGRLLRRDNVTTPAAFSAQFDSPVQMFRILFGHHTIKPDAARIFDMYKSWKEAVAEIADVEGLRPTFVINPAQKSAFTAAKTNGVGNVWGLDDDQDYIWWQLSTAWDHAKDDLRVTAWSRSVVERLHAENRALGLSHEFIYGGDSGEYQNIFAGIPADNLAKLRTIRQEYDDAGVFRRLNWGGFKIGF